MTTIARLLSASVLVVPALTSLAADSDFSFQWGHPRPQGNSIHTILPVGGQSAYAVGEFGCVLHTADDGQTWELRQDLNGIRKHFFDVLALDADSLVVAGEAPGLYRSDDGGFSWEVIPVPVETTLRDLDLLPDGDLSAAGDGGVVLRSSDQGATWTEMGPGVGEIRAHHWTADDTCIVAGDDVFHRTTNAGASWIQLGTPPSFGFNELFFIDGLNGRVNSDFERWQTTDGGVTWTEVGGFNFPLYRHDTLVLDSQHWLAITAGEGAELWETFDAGQTWANLHYRGAVSFLGIAQLPSGRVLLTTDLGDLLYSDDLGVTLTNAADNLDEDSPAPINTIAARADGVLFAVNQPSTPNGSTTWLRSDDGGTMWTKPAQSPDLRWVLALEFRGNDLGLAGAYDDLRYTSDGGETWSVAALPADQRVSDVAIPNDSRMLVSTYSLTTGGGAYRSDDGGATWVVANDGISLSLQAGPLFFVDESVGFLFGRVNQAPSLNFTDSAGQVWGQIPTTGLPNAPHDMWWADVWTGVVAVHQGDEPGIYRTVDGGSNWTRVYDERCIQVVFRDAMNGLALHSFGGSIIVTHDGGATWEAADVPVSGRIESIGVSGNDFILGASGTRLLVMSELSDLPGDLDGDGDVDQADLGILLACYGNSDCGDLDGDGDTDQADLGILLANYGG